jgi:ornithine cyclodeaminase/alanine dehydrogenase-like protein (mu-crystallin family)
MVLFLTEKEVGDLLDLREAIPVVEEALREHGEGRATNRPRQRVSMDGVTLHVLPAAVSGIGSMGLKAYITRPGGGRFWVLLLGTDGALRAIMEADLLGQVRTGAATGVATRHLSRPDSRQVGILGTGLQARTQLEAVCAVRPIERVRAWSPTRKNLDKFCAEMANRLSLPVEPASDERSAVIGADILITMTKAQDPVLLGEWLEPGTHINAAGSNQAINRELDAAAVARADLIVVDDLDQSRVESGDLIFAENEGAVRWEDLAELGAVVAGKARGRQKPEDVTLFESHGIGIWDIALAHEIYEAARERNLGTTLPIEAGPGPAAT